MLNKKYSSEVAAFNMFVFHEGLYDCKEHHLDCTSVVDSQL